MAPVDDRARWLTKLDTCGVMICNPCWSRLIVASLIRKKTRDFVAHSIHVMLKCTTSLFFFSFD
jgi:gluconate kinase